MMTIRGDILVSVLVFAAVAVTMVIGLVNWGATLIVNARMAVKSEQAFEIAEAGLSSFRGNIANITSDNQTHTYKQDFFDKDGNILGNYVLEVAPTTVGSTKISVSSKGSVDLNSSKISRTIEAVFGLPTFTKYAIVSNDGLIFSFDTETSGPVMANGVIHFNGIANNIISSATAVDGSGVFYAGKQAPVTVVDFSGLGADFQGLQTVASSSGTYYARSQYDESPAYGYHIALNQDDTFTLYTVTELVAAPAGCSSATAGWGTWSIHSQSFLGTYTLPVQGLLFFNDDVWVDGTIDGSRLTIAANNITVNSDLSYIKYDNTEALGLIAKENINIGLVSADSLHIDGALIAENGRVGRFFYPSACRVDGIDYSHRSTLTLNGSIATNKKFGFTYTDGTAYTARNIAYDVNLAGNPPPYFPIIKQGGSQGNQYKMISWKEVR